MARSLFFFGWALSVVCLAPPARAQGYVDSLDVDDIPEVDVVFKCHSDSRTPEAALYGLAHRFSRRRDRVYSVLMSATESRFGYVSAPFAVSAPALYERDGVIVACVTVQSLASLQLLDAEEAEEPGPETPDSVDASLDEALDEALSDDPNMLMDGNSLIDDANDWRPATGAPPAYEEEDDLRIPGLPIDPVGRPFDPPELDDDSAAYLDPNNETDRPFFDPNDFQTEPYQPVVPDMTPAPAPAPAVDPTLLEPETATAPRAEEVQEDDTPPPAGEDMTNDPVPVDPGLPTDLPGFAPWVPPSAPSSSASSVPNAAQEAVLDEQTDVLPSPDNTHGPIVHPDSRQDSR